MSYCLCPLCYEEIVYAPGEQVVCPKCGADFGILQPSTMSEFCPKCGALLEVTPEPDRLCGRCGWFGDKDETVTTPPVFLNIQENVRRALDLYRNVCRQEYTAEQAMEKGLVTWTDMQRIRAAVKSAREALLTMFDRIHGNPDENLDEGETE